MGEVVWGGWCGGGGVGGVVRSRVWWAARYIKKCRSGGGGVGLKQRSVRPRTGDNNEGPRALCTQTFNGWKGLGSSSWMKPEGLKNAWAP